MLSGDVWLGAVEFDGLSRSGYREVKRYQTRRVKMGVYRLREKDKMMVDFI